MFLIIVKIQRSCRETHPLTQILIPFNNLAPAHARSKDAITAAIAGVLDRAYYLLGIELEAFEAAFAAYHGVGYAVGVANGTDAIELALRAGDIGAGDEVITVAHTAVPTVCAIESTGACPVFVDIDPVTYTLDPAQLDGALTSRTRAIIPVHLYGQAANMDAISAFAQQHDLLLVEDCAQAHGARWCGRLVGTFGQMAAFSFYPTKNLGAYGDGGAVLTNDTALAARLRRLRSYGQSARYVHDERGINSRLDEMQAAILRVKLVQLDSYNTERQMVAALYTAALSGLDVLSLPCADERAQHVYHLYVVQHPDRDTLMARLTARGVGTLIHYPIPVHRQVAYADLGWGEGSLPVTEAAARSILSLPLYIGMGDLAETTAQIVREEVLAMQGNLN